MFSDKSEKTVKQIMPADFLNRRYKKTLAFQLKDEVVLNQHSKMWDQDAFKKWPGRHKYVNFWVELQNGYCIGLNENPNNGWSFPVLNLNDNKNGKI